MRKKISFTGTSNERAVMLEEARQGIMVSRYDGLVDWNALAADGIWFALVCAGFGGDSAQKDPYFERNCEEAERVGVHTGAYWYSTAATTAEALKEADARCAAISGRKLDMPVYFCQMDKACEAAGEAYRTLMATAFCSALIKQNIFPGYCCYDEGKELIDCESMEKMYTCLYVKQPRGGGAKTLWIGRDYPREIVAGGHNGFAGRGRVPRELSCLPCTVSIKS